MCENKNSKPKIEIAANTLVSIIIPSYNRADFLTEAVKSIISQTYRPIECIIVDDGSTDNTKEIVEQFISNNTDQFEIKYIFQERAGAQVARNTGTAKVSGAFIQYLDSDDFLYLQKLERQVNFLQTNPTCDGVFGDWEEGIPENKKKITIYKSDNLLLQIINERCIANFSFLMRAEIVKKIGNWDTNLKRNQEIDFHLRGVLVGGNFEYQPLNTGLWRLHPKERIGNATNFSDAINFYHKWEVILRSMQLWNESFSKGVVNNYIWFLNNNSKESKKEIRKLLNEVYRLMPHHPIFNNQKFKIAKRLSGNKMALNIWINRYKKKFSTKL